jgi:hypothetical protein
VAVCQVCGNDYDKTFQITLQGKTHTFDSFECAIYALGSALPHCGVRIVGQGVEQGDIFCCGHSVQEVGASRLQDRA